MIKSFSKKIIKQIIYTQVRQHHFITSSNDVFRIFDKNNKILTKNQFIENKNLCFKSQIGLSLYNLNEMGEIVYKEKLLNDDDILEQDESYLEVETVKSSNEMISPIGGIIEKYNDFFIEEINNIEDLKLINEEKRKEFMDKNNLYFVSVKLSQDDINNLYNNINNFEYHNDD